MSKKPTKATEQFRKNCELNQEVLINLGAFDSKLLRVDCSKVEAPKGATAKGLKKDTEVLAGAKAQLKKIDNRRAY